MRVLLDTSYLYGLMEAQGRFSDEQRRFFSEHEVQLHVSAVSIWEMRLKYHALRASGERKSPFDPTEVVSALEKLGTITILPLTERHAASELQTSLSHRDPFDELLLVQAQEEDLRLLTTDRRLIGHPLALTA
jgi:PIN domain nuclease of toxin-antitoxin system